MIASVQALSEEDRVLGHFFELRDEALGSEVWRRHKTGVNTMNLYLTMRNHPPGMAPDEIGTTTDDFYLIFPVIIDHADRLTSLTSAGHYELVMESSNTIIQDLIEPARDLHIALQRRANLKGRVHDMSRDMVCFGLGGVRAHVDSRRNPLMPTIGFERMMPGTFWLSPYANDGYSRVLGSDYVGHDMFRRRSWLRVHYGKTPAMIKLIDSIQGIPPGGVVTEDPLDPLYNGITSRNMRTSQSSYPRNRGGKSSDQHISDNDLIRVCEFVYRDYEERPLLGAMSELMGGEFANITYEGEAWKHSLIMLPFGGQRTARAMDTREKASLLQHDTIKFDEPWFVLASSWLLNSGPYALAPAMRMSNTQDTIDTMMSSVVAQMLDVARTNRMTFSEKGAIEPEVLEELASGSGRRHVQVKDPRGYRGVRELIGKVDAQSPNLNEHVVMLRELLNLNELISGVHSPVRGDVDGSSRLSGRAIGALQTAALTAQDTPRMHMDWALSELGRLLWQIQSYTMSNTFKAGDVGGKSGALLNERMPARGFLAGYRDLNDEAGPDRIPNGLRARRKDGEEEMYQADFSDPRTRLLLQKLSERDDVVPGGIDITFNDMAVFRPEITMRIDHEYKEIQRDRMEKLAMLKATDPNAVSWDTSWKVAFGDDPLMDIDAERDRLWGQGTLRTVAETLQTAQTMPELRESFERGLASLMQNVQQEIAALEAASAGGDSASGPVAAQNGVGLAA